MVAEDLVIGKIGYSVLRKSFAVEYRAFGIVDCAIPPFAKNAKDGAPQVWNDLPSLFLRQLAPDIQTIEIENRIQHERITSDRLAAIHRINGEQDNVSFL